MRVGIPKETFPGEKRVSCVPGVVPLMIEMGLEVLVEKGAGEEAGFSDELYTKQGAKLSETRKEIFVQSDIILQVHGGDEQGLLRKGHILIGQFNPLNNSGKVAEACTGSFNAQQTSAIAV